jgi:hypothetical protein
MEAVVDNDVVVVIPVNLHVEAGDVLAGGEIQ